MKRVLCLSLVLTILCALLTFTPAAAAIYDDLFYENRGNHIEITGCINSSGSIDIPAEIDGIPVTNIDSLGSYNSSLTNINIPDSVTSIAYGAFYGCDSLLNITVAAGNQNYCDIDGVLFNKYKTEIHTFPQDKIQSEYTIPDGVTSIGSYAFYECENLTDINIPSSVTNIGPYAFSYCRNLTSVDIPVGVTSIDTDVFYKCENLTNINIPSSVTSIGPYAFSHCSSLTSVNIPAGVTSIGRNAFSDSGYYNNKANWENDILYIGDCLIQ